jgi:hypothetical protein
MRWRINAVLLGAMVVAAAIGACGKKGAKYDVNLLRNGSFEEVGSDGMPAGWILEPFRGGEGESEVQYGLDTRIFADGKASWFFRGDPGTRRWYMLSQEVPIADGTTHIEVRGRLQTDGTRVMPDQFVQCNFLLTFYDREHRRFQGLRVADQRTPYRAGTNPWMEEKHQFRLPGGTRFVKVSCVLGTNGQAWFDDVALVAPAPIPWETATTENFIFHWLPGRPMPEGSQSSQQQIFDYVESRLNLQSDVIINYYFYPDTATIRETLSIRGFQYVSWDDLEFHSVNSNDNHEVVHFITDKIGRPPRALAEGTVFWLQGEWDGRPIDECMRDLSAANAVAGLDRLLDSAVLGASDPNTTMPALASFVGFLVQRWGPDKLMQLYAATHGRDGYDGVVAAFQPVYGTTLADAEAAWRTVVRADAARPAGSK